MPKGIQEKKTNQFVEHIWDLYLEVWADQSATDYDDDQTVIYNFEAEDIEGADSMDSAEIMDSEDSSSEVINDNEDFRTLKMLFTI